MISKACVELVKKFEGCRLKSYLCPANVWTAGYGHTGPGVGANLTISQEVADKWLKQDLEKFNRGLHALVMIPLKQWQEDALTSLVFNIGLEAFENSTLRKHLNNGRIYAAANEFLRWNRAGGKVLAGLTKRREAEKAMFEGKA